MTLLKTFGRCVEAEKCFSEEQLQLLSWEAQPSAPETLGPEPNDLAGVVGCSDCGHMAGRLTFRALFEASILESCWTAHLRTPNGASDLSGGSEPSLRLKPLGDYTANRMRMSRVSHLSVFL